MTPGPTGCTIRDQNVHGTAAVGGLQVEVGMQFIRSDEIALKDRLAAYRCARQLDNSVAIPTLQKIAMSLPI